MSPQVWAAAIAAVISGIGLYSSYIVAKWTVTQTQLTEVLKARAQHYPRLWKIMVEHSINWTGERNQKWAGQFLMQFRQCNAEIGVFFSHPVYKCLVTLRERLTKLEAQQGEVTASDYDEIVRLLGVNPGDEGLATRLKDDLGSYSRPSLRKKSPLAKS